MEVKKVSSGLPIAKSQKRDVSFSGVSKVAVDTLDEATKSMKSKMPRSVGILEKLSSLNCEAGGIIINAIGTGLVAPIFIAFNPLSDADEDTKKYSALRQPVSAVLAVLIQAGLTKPLDNLYEKLSNEGKLGKSVLFNQSLMNSDSYIKKAIKSTPGYDSSSDISSVVAKKSEAQIQKVVENLNKTGRIVFNENLELNDKQMLELLDKTLGDYGKEIETSLKKIKSKDIAFKVKRAIMLVEDESQIRELCKALNGDNVDLTALKDILSRNKNSDNANIRTLVAEFSTYLSSDEPERAIKSRAEKTLQKINIFAQAVENSRILASNSDTILVHLNAIKDSTSNDAVNNALNQLRELANHSGDNKEYNGLHQIIERIEKASSSEIRSTYIQKITDRIDEYKKAGAVPEKLVEIYQRGYYEDKIMSLENELNIVKQLREECKTAKSGIKSLITSVQKTLKDKIDSIKDKDFATDIVKKLKSTIEKRIKGFKQVTNILFGLFVTLPITCTALNWVYPRFMDIFFPDLSGNKKSDAPEEKAKIKKKGAK